MSAWTPGPWFVEQTWSDSYRIKSEDFGGIALIHDPYANIEESSAPFNARLIAAAPEMAELLERLMNALLVYDGHVTDETNASGWTEREPYDAFMAARALLAKVEGK